MKQLNSRQIRILEYLKVDSDKSAGEIEAYLIGVSRATINRDLDLLLEENKIYKKGKGKSTKYFISKGYTHIKPFSIDYFYKNPQKRNIRPDYNLKAIKELGNIDIFDNQEREELQALTEKYRNNVKKIDKTVFSKELERIIIELSWMSSKIEGNTYSLIETQLLLEKNKKANDKTRAETEMILNHKEAIEYISKNKKDFIKLESKNIVKVHSILIKNLEAGGYRNSPVGITGTLYRPLVGRKNLEKEMSKIVKLTNSKELPFDKSLLINLLLAYLQAFKDGNKRTARIMGNALLLAHDCVPLSLLTLDEERYRRAIILFYEQNNISLFKEIFLEQYRFSVENYFLS